MYRIFAVDDNQPIGPISVGGSGYTLLVGRLNQVPPIPSTGLFLDVAGGGTIGAIDAPNGTVQVRSTNSVVSVNAATVVRVDARNSIGNVTCTSAIGVLQAPSIGGVAAPGNITRVRVAKWDMLNGMLVGNDPSDYVSTISSTSGNIVTVAVEGAARMRGTITADQGTIGNVTAAASGGVGPASGTPSIIRARNGITSVTAPTINADINARFNGGSGQLQFLNASTGNFTGSLQATTLGTSIVAGNCAATITLDAFPAGALLSINGALTSPVALGGGGLRGQIIVNRANAGGTWQSPASATVGGVPLTLLPAYDLGSMTLGCGAIGRIPFALYSNDCMPPLRPTPGTIGRLAFFRPINPQAALVRFYGPVKVASGTDPATGVIVERQNGAVWNDVTSDFTLTFQALEAGGAVRQIRVADNTSSAADPANGIFRVVPRLSGGVSLLLCDVPTQPPVATFDYRFQIQEGCYNPSLDLDLNGVVDPDDLADFITCYFSVPPCTLADYNCDSLVNPDDLADFISAYFLPCN